MIPNNTTPSSKLDYRIDKSRKYPELSRCKDFSTLIEHFTDEELNRFEWEINKYDRGGKITIIACWVEGLIATSDLIEMYEED